MTDTRFTPMPWFINDRYKPSDMACSIMICAPPVNDQRFGQVICDLQGRQLEPKAQSVGQARNNANLIAAAPDLYAALENCQQYVVAWQLEYGTKPKDDHADKTLRDIENALAKARGET